MKELSQLSAVSLLSKKLQVNNLVDKARNLLIEQGYGNETFFDTEKRALATNDELAKRYVGNCLLLKDIMEECRQREQFHGSLKPIKRK